MPGRARRVVRLPRWLLGLWVAWLWWAVPVAAHEGPAYALITHAPAGPYTVSVWADPDVGDGRVLVQVLAPAGASPDVTVEARAAEGPSAPLVVVAEPSQGQAGIARDTWVAALPFGRPGDWQLTVRLAGPAGAGDLRTTTTVLPEGPTGGEVYVFALPFALLFLLLAGAWWSTRSRAAEPPIGAA